MKKTYSNPNLQAYLLDAKKKKRRSHEEEDECEVFYAWSQFNHLLHGNVIHIPNQGKRPPHVGSRLLRLGMQPGIPDYLILVPTRRYFGLAIEMKIASKKNHAMPEHQVEYLTKLNKKNWYAVFAFGANHAIKITEDYLANRI